MSPWVPADHAVRQRIEHRGDQSVMVEAGAGTGKTELMVRRAVAMIRAGYTTIDQLVIITFTEAAAAEIAARTRQALQLLVDGSPEEIKQARMKSLSAFEHMRVRDALDGIHRARIQTIHSFCAAMLRERPVEAKLDPAFVQLDEVQASAHFERAFRDWLDGILAMPPGGLALATEMGLGISKVRALAEVMQMHRALLPMEIPVVQMPDIGRLVDVLDQSAKELRTLIQHCDPADPGARDIRKIVGLADQVTSLWDIGDEKGVMRLLLTAAPELRHGAGVLAAWDDPDRGRRATVLRKEVRGALEAAQDELGTYVLMGLMPVIQDFVRSYADKRRHDGEATFDDLLIWARELLRDEQALRYFRKDITRLIVDEFQDTDPVQADIVMCLASEEAPPVGNDWTGMAPLKGRLAVVGDPKQSIYRFRRADIAMFDDIRTGVMKPHKEQITQNFRSREQVIAWVNRVFSAHFAPEHGVQPGYVDLVHAPRAVDISGPAVHVAWAETQEKIGPARQCEADLLARMLIDAHDGDEKLKVFDAEKKEARDVEWGDMVVLVPAWTDFDEFRDALRHMGVPFRVGGGRGFFARGEVADICHLLEAIDDPLNDIAVAAALRSPIFGCSDDDLVLAKATGRGINYRQRPTSQCPPPVADGLRTIRDMHDRLPELTLVEAVTLAVDTSLLVEQALIRDGDGQAAANLMKVIDMARRFGDAGPVGDTAGLRDFSRWMREQREIEDDDLRSSLRESDAGIADAGDDVVRVMTIHAAKGLEFPLVALANICGRRNIDRAPFPDRRKGTVHVRIKGSGGTHFESPGFGEAWETESRAQEAEATRLMYVAATRARDHILIPLALAEQKFGPYAKVLREHLPGRPAAEVDLDDDVMRVVPGEVLAAVSPLGGRGIPVAQKAAVDEAAARRAAWLEDRAALLERASAELRVTAASAQGGVGSPPADGPLGPALSGPSAGPDDTEASRKGRALHMVMELVDYAVPTHIDAMVGRACVEEDAVGHEAEVRVWVDACLTSDAVRRANAADGVHREVPFTIAVDDGEAYEVGRIDLVIRNGHDLTIVDWKSDRVTAGEEQAHTEEWHRDQAEAYVRALRASLPGHMHVGEVVFVYARTGGEGIIRPEGLF